MMANTSERKYEDFEPVSDLLSEKECDTLLLYLPGFRKEQLKVQLTTSRILKISGERPIGDNKWKRFHKEFNVPSNIDMKDMTAKFEGGILYIRQPKLITPATTEQKHDEGKTAAEAERPASQPQYEAPTEGKTEQKDKEDKMEKKEKDETPAKDQVGSKVKHELNEIRKQVGGRSELFKELRKPGTQKRLAVYVILILILGFQAIKMFKSFTKVEEKSVMEYDHHEL
ncbi:inactive protein RESTRICTED TEV MOVEMENT 2-like [Chenopodium quinoa]|uniref:SHSP domain-containing protein n=1 Tax=Chenopodium quinoa TaxID=63459 RepID=A0A803KRD6_CHEQI|nr:inactive protein RESTRICTED TEV MOVEMENT 2-like [Chenopodium quinoa]